MLSDTLALFEGDPLMKRAHVVALLLTTMFAVLPVAYGGDNPVVSAQQLADQVHELD
jgi:hypothetical protein